MGKKTRYVRAALRPRVADDQASLYGALDPTAPRKLHSARVPCDLSEISVDVTSPPLLSAEVVGVRWAIIVVARAMIDW